MFIRNTNSLIELSKFSIYPHSPHACHPSDMVAQSALDESRLMLSSLQVFPIKDPIM